MTSIADEVRSAQSAIEPEGYREPVTVPVATAAQFAGILVAGIATRVRAAVPEGALPGLVSHLDAWLRNVQQGSIADAEYAAFLELVARTADPWDAPPHPFDCPCEPCGVHASGLEGLESWEPE